MSDQYLDVEEERRSTTSASSRSSTRCSTSWPTAKSMPLSSSVMVSRDEVTSLLQSALERLPDELRQARWLLREREEFMAERTREAEALMDEVRAQAEHMVQRTEIVRQANSVAQRILDDANEEARTLRHQAEDFVRHQAGRHGDRARPPDPHGPGRPGQAGRAPRGGGVRTTTEPGARRTASSTRTSPWRWRADPFLVHVARLRRSPAAPRTRSAAARSCWPGPLDEAGIDPGRSVVPAGAEAEIDVTLHPFEGGIEAEGTVTRTLGRDLPPLRRAGVGRAAHRASTSGSATSPLAGHSDDELYPITDDDHRSRPAGARRHRARAAHGAPVPGGLRRPVPPVRGQPQRGRLRLRCPSGSPMG